MLDKKRLKHLNNSVTHESYKSSHLQPLLPEPGAPSLNYEEEEEDESLDLSVLANLTLGRDARNGDEGRRSLSNSRVF